MILANKQDISSALPIQEIAERLELKKLKSHTWHILPCSARAETEKDRRIWEGLDWVVNEVEGRIYYGTGKKEKVEMTSEEIET